jgi:hypothetical protein
MRTPHISHKTRDMGHPHLRALKTRRPHDQAQYLALLL